MGVYLQVQANHFNKTGQLGRWMIMGMLALGQTAWAQVPAKPEAGPWSVSLGLGAMSAPEYEGAKKLASSPVPIVSVSYKTQAYGTFSVGQKGLGLAWTALETDAYSLGISVGASSGRVDNKRGTVLSPGSTFLRGMGEIEPEAEFGVFGSINLGFPVMVGLTKGAGDGKVNAKDFSTNGHGGTRLEVSTEIPFQLTEALGLSFSPSITWADQRYTQANFGVSSAQAARTAFKTYTTKAGIKSLGLTIGVRYQLAPHWMATTALTFSQLQGDAAKSPLVQRKAQPSAMAGVAYMF